MAASASSISGFWGRRRPSPSDRSGRAVRGGTSITILVTDFSLPTAKVFTGSSNFSPSGENKNGDHFIMIEDRGVAIAYAIEAMRVFDHLQFRNRMDAALGPDGKRLAAARAPRSLSLRKPTAISGKAAWYERFYESGTQIERDRKLFSR